MIAPQRPLSGIASIRLEAGAFGICERFGPLKDMHLVHRLLVVRVMLVVVALFGSFLICVRIFLNRLACSTGAAWPARRLRQRRRFLPEGYGKSKSALLVVGTRG